MNKHRNNAHEFLTLTPEIRTALNESMPIVAMESTIISHGIPYPQNVALAGRLDAIIRQAGAIPAMTAVAEGKILIGLDDQRLEQLAFGQGVTKMSQRDMPALLASGRMGATTVASTMVAADLAGIRVFATGGIGGVHRGVEETSDISPDLDVLSRINTIVVTAGAKAILDLPRTLEYLETRCVPVIGYQTGSFPAFYSRDTELPVTMRCDTPGDVAAFIARHDALGFQTGIVVANPIPKTHELPAAEIENAIADAVSEAHFHKISGKRLTPFLLGRLVELTDGRSVAANVALAEHNAQVAAEIAVAMNKRAN